MLKIIKTCASKYLLCFSNDFMHLSPAPASSSLHLDFPAVQGNIFLGFFCWLGWVGFLFGFGVGFFAFFFLPLLLSLDIFSLLLVMWEVQVRHDKHIGTQEWFSQEQQHKERLPRAWPGAGVLTAALCAIYMQICPSCPSILLFYSWSQENQPQSAWHGEVQRWPGTLVGVTELV